MTRRYMPTCTVVTLLMVGDLLLLFTPPSAFGQVRLQRLLENHLLMVVDAGNKRLGQVIAEDDRDAVVYFKINGQAVMLAVGPREIGGLAHSDVAFASTNCTGQGFLTGVRGLEFSPVAVVAPGNTVYLPVPGSRAQPFTLRSVLPGRYRSRIFGEECRQYDPPFESSGVPAQVVVNLNRVFTPPFRVLVTTRP